MNVTLTQPRFGPGYFQPTGQTMDLPDAEAKSLIEGKRAVPARGHKAETAVASRPTREAAVSRQGSNRKDPR